MAIKKKKQAAKFKDALGAKLRKLREALGVNVLQAATQAGVGYRSLSRWENDGAKPHQAQLVQLAAFYGVKPEDLA